MNLKEYIESGKLEAYVLGGLDASEAREVERFAKEFPEIAQELNKLHITIEKYAQSMAVTPKADVKKALMETIDNNYKQTKTPIWYNVAIAASLVLIVTLAATTFYYRDKWLNTETQLISIQQEKAVLAQQANYQRESLDEYRNFVSVVSDTNVSKIVMKGTENFPLSMATVYWNRSTNEIFLDPSGLPGVPEDKQFQLWAIIDGKPVDAGVFVTGSSQPLMKMKISVETAQAFAVTLEPKGGSVSPTMEAMYVIGQPS